MYLDLNDISGYLLFCNIIDLYSTLITKGKERSNLNPFSLHMFLILFYNKLGV